MPLQLYTFVDTGYLAGRNPVDVAQQLCQGGSDMIQLRAKNSTASEVERLARQLLPVCQHHGVDLVINDHWTVACQTGAPFCHLGQEDFDAFSDPSGASQLPASASPRAVLSASHRPRLGLSTHSPDQALRAIEAGANYIAIGPVFPTGTKPNAVPVTLEYVRWAAAHVKIPWFAIGGINLSNLDDVLQAGAPGICVVAAILTAPDITSACRAFKDRLSSYP